MHLTKGARSSPATRLAHAGLALFALLATDTCARGHSSESAVDFKFEVLDEHEAPTPCRVHLRKADGTVWKASSWPAFDDHFIYPGTATFALPVGVYSYDVERGPEYERRHGSFEVRQGGPSTLSLRLGRIADLTAQGWYSGDLHIHRKVEDVPLLMRAEDLNVGPVVTWWNSLSSNRPPHLERGGFRLDGDRLIDASVGEDERWGGAVLYFGLTNPLALPPSMMNDRGQIAHRQGDELDEYPAPAQFAYIARNQPGVHIDIEKPFWWDVPTWVGLGLADSIEIAYNHMTRASLHNNEAWGKERDPNVYGGPLGDAYWGQDIYYRILDAGVRLAPSAGSASGALPNPVGYNRVYVHLDGRFDYDAWWQGLRAGHSFVTNGPLLLVTANGELPGHVFRGAPGVTIKVLLETRVLSNEPIGKIELVRDGCVTEKGAYDAAAGTAVFEPLSFERSGWFLIRAIADRDDTFRFASTAPFYVQIEATPRRISRKSVLFFVDWVTERMNRLRGGTMPTDKLESVMSFHRDALGFWQRQLARANAD